MLSTSRVQIAGETDEQARERGVHFQSPVECSLGPEQTIYYSSLCQDFLTPPVSDDPYPEIFLPASGFKSESDPFGWETSLGMETSNSPSPEMDRPRNHAIPIILGNGSNGDNIEPVQHFPVREPVKQGNTRIVAKPVTKSRKRCGTEAFSTNEGESDSVRAKQKAKIDTDNTEKTRSQFACPFQKLDSHKHHECLKYELNRIKDVKQHVYRRHKQPDYYCARCFAVFKTADARDEHARSKDCDNLEDPGFEGISEDQKNRLNKSSSRGLDPQDQWFEMWDIIFPDVPRPSSAWVGSYMEEMVPLLRSLWNHKNSSILAKVQKRQAKPLNRDLLNEVLGSIFDCLEDEASGSLKRRARGASSQNQHGLMGGQLPTSTLPSKVITESPHPFFAEPHDIFQEINAAQEAEFRNGFVFREG